MDKNTQLNITNDIMSNSNTMERLIKLSNIMATGIATVPEHLRKSPGDCLAICIQAHLWHMNPFAVAQKTSTVGGKLTYEGQLINAVITSLMPLQGRINFEFKGDWEKIEGNFNMKTSANGRGQYAQKAWAPQDEFGLSCIVSATLKDDSQPKLLETKMILAINRFSTLWATDPQQQLSYFALRRWARRHFPDCIMGIYAPDEIDRNIDSVSSFREQGQKKPDVPLALPSYQEDSFLENKEKWSLLINNQGKEPQAIIDTISNKWILSESQQEEILGLKQLKEVA